MTESTNPRTIISVSSFPADQIDEVSDMSWKGEKSSLEWSLKGLKAVKSFHVVF